MGTVADYFASDCTGMNIRNQLQLFTPQGECIGQTITLKIHLLIDAHSKYLSIYAGSEVAFPALLKHLEHPDLRSCNVLALMGQNKDAAMSIGVHQGRQVSVNDLVFSRKLLLYVAWRLSEEEKRQLNSHAESVGFIAEIRDLAYAEYRARSDRPLAFISHAKSDSRKLAVDLAGALSGNGCPVWFDEFSLKVGDSLLDSITQGLRSTDKCIIVLSPDFLANEGWCKYEFKTAAMIQIVERRDVFLPVWHGVTKEMVYEYNPLLAEVVGISTDELKLGEVAKRISKVLLDRTNVRA